MYCQRSAWNILDGIIIPKFDIMFVKGTRHNYRDRA